MTCFFYAGRTTTFFDNELDEKTKALIGDIAPKKIDPNEVKEVSNTLPPTVSAWNSAGTFESKSYSEWARGRLKDLLLSCIKFPIAGTLFYVETQVKEITGDAEITSARGKRKHICDLEAELEWKLTGGPQNANGIISVRDITIDRDYDTQVTVDRESHPETINVIQTYIKVNGSGYQRFLFDIFDNFCAEFQTK